MGACLLAVILALSMIVPFIQSPSQAYAANEGTLIIYKLSSVGVTTPDPGTTYYQNPADNLYYEYIAGATYTVYRIGTFSQTTDTSTTPPTVSIDYVPVPGLVYNDGTAVDLNAGTVASNIDTTGLTAVASGTSTATAPITLNTGLDADGVYLVKETTPPPDVNGSNDFIITVPMYLPDADGGSSWQTTITAYPKNIIANADISKTITNLTQGDPNIFYANVGDSVEYEVTVDVPGDIETSNYTTFSVVDTYNATQIGITPASVAIESDLGTTYIPTTDYTVTNAGGVMTIAFTATGIGKLQNGEILTITYDGTVLAATADPANAGSAANTATLQTAINGTPLPPVSSTVNPEILIYSYGVKKLDELGDPLGGASFVLSSENPVSQDIEYLIYNATTALWTFTDDISAATVFTTDTLGNDLDSEAILQFYNLDPAASYYLVETDAPTNYIPLPDPITLLPDTGTTDAVYASYDADGDYVSDVGYSLTITNQLANDVPGVLPATGGSGIYLFLIIGGILVLAAGALYVWKRRKAQATSLE